MSDDLPARQPADQSVGTFIRRLFWRRNAGPVSAEASVEIRELNPDPAAPRTRSGDEIEG